MSRRERPPLTWATVDAILGELEEAGFVPGDQVHRGMAISAIRRLGELYAGERDTLDIPARLGLVPSQESQEEEEDAPGRPMTGGGWLSGPMP